MNKIYLSFVIVTRNDGHDPDMRRLHICLRTLMRRLKTVRAEIVLVDWNPLPDRQLVIEAIDLPLKLRNWRVRSIIVSPELHQEFAWTDKLDLYVLAGRNVGIRRAWGEFVLPLNQDCVLSDDLIEFLDAGALKKDLFYRVDRCDVSANVPYPADVHTQVAFCRKTIFRCHGWHKGEAFHTGASGDFLLMSRDAWHSLRGYVELPFYGLHLDSVQVYRATLEAGLIQNVLSKSKCLYHIDHKHSWPYRSEKEFVQAGIPILPMSVFSLCRDRMLGGKQAFILNGDVWGFSGEDLPEIERVLR